jgi:hypothetical protein
VAASGSLGYTAPGDIKLAQTVPPGLKGSVVTDSAAMSIDWSRDGKAIATGSWALRQGHLLPRLTRGGRAWYRFTVAECLMARTRPRQRTISERSPVG